MNPQILLGGILAAVLMTLIGAAAGYSKGHHDAARECTVHNAKATEAVHQEVKVEQAVVDQHATTLETKNAQTEVVYQTVTKYVDRIVEKPIYRDGVVCLDDDGVRAINAAVNGAAIDPGQSKSPLPASR